MPKTTLAAIVEFAGIIVRYREKGFNVESFPKEDVKIIMQILSEAGLKPKEINLGKISDNRGVINTRSPFHVINEEGFPAYFATGWLNAMFADVAYYAGQLDDEKLWEFILEKVLECIPFEPIQLTPEGDMLIEMDKKTDHMHPYYVKHVQDSDSINKTVLGIHKYCDGAIQKRRISKTHNVLCCPVCQLRLPFPNTIKTYRELRKFFEVKQVPSTI